MIACFFSRQWLGLRFGNCSAPAGPTRDAGKRSHKWQAASCFPIHWPPCTHSRHKCPYACRESRQETQRFVISGSLAALWSRLLPAPEKKISDDSVWLRLNGFGSQWRRCFSFMGLFPRQNLWQRDHPPFMHTHIIIFCIIITLCKFKYHCSPVQWYLAELNMYVHDIKTQINFTFVFSYKRKSFSLCAMGILNTRYVTHRCILGREHLHEKWTQTHLCCFCAFATATRNCF